MWLYENGQLRPLRLRLGIADGNFSELLTGDLEPGTELVTNVTTGAETSSNPGGIGQSPLMGGRRGFPGGGFGGGRPGQGAGPR